MSASRLVWVLSSIVFLAGLAWLATPVVSAPAVQDGDKVDLFDEMMGIRQALRALSQQIDDPAQDGSSLNLIWTMQKHIINARQASPPTLEKTPADQRDAHMKAYHKSIAEVLKAMADMEIQLLEGRRVDVKKSITETLFPLREAAHDMFQDLG